MTGYLYETHLHTSEASACGRVSGSDYIDFMMSRGFSGMFVTDHFFNGNSCVPQHFPWEKKVERYVSGYRKALEAARGKDFDVLFGVEYNFHGDEYLIYGVDETWLLHNDDIMRCSKEEVYRRVHQAGGIMIQAHPYRERNYLKDIRLTPAICDGIEVFNSANPDNQNALAYQYALELKVPMTAGSDIHFFHEDAMGGMLFPERIQSPAEYVDAVLHREGVPVRVHRGELRAVADLPELTEPKEEPTLPVLHF
jgi:hypothetical protein